VMGHASRVLRASEVLMAMDGRPRNMTSDNFLLAFDLNARSTFLDFYKVVMQDNNGFGKQTLDYWRHRHRMNVLYCDSHVEDADMTDEALDAIGLSKGLYP
jgi:prepilin-type processing-associated H-X9-DG protein